ncbi:MAG: exonuclease SbcCD subunit D [Clostridia bacterium]|nr:exonuclease SbcCD subunit D [Clostridia bacterium]
MKIFHISDLHLGKRLNDYSLIDDQKYILTKIINAADEEKPDAVIIAGDVYDKSVPSAEAVALFDDFLCRLARRRLTVLVISGNHDSPERIAFGGRLMEASGVHLSPVYDGSAEKVTVGDAYGEVDFYLLPFIKPANVRRFFPDEEIVTYTDALRRAVGAMEVDPSKRSVLVTHQFVTGARRSDSEEISVGGADNVDGAVFDCFDYVALGHIHGPQNVGRETLRYCGTPLKYSLSEAGDTKSITSVEMKEKGNTTVREIPLVPMRDLREIRGTYGQLTLRENYEGTATDDYLHVVLTDEDDVPDALARLRIIYPNILDLDFDNARTRAAYNAELPDLSRYRSEAELFGDFFEKQNGRPMTEEQTARVAALFEKIKEESL